MNASQFEARLKELVGRLQSEFGEPKDVTTGDVVEEILLGVFGRDTTEAKAREALARLRSGMVDYNEMRVAAPVDVIEELGLSFPGVKAKALDMVRVLSTMYEQIETLDLAEMKGKPKRESHKWLADLPGMDPYTLGRVMLLCFGGHAVPVSTSVLANLQAQGLFEATVTPAEAQGVLERHVRAPDALKTFWLLHRWAEKHPAPPPKSSSSNSAAGGRKKPAKAASGKSPDKPRAAAKTKPKAKPAPAGKGKQK
jgi:endonuclease III